MQLEEIGKLQALADVEAQPIPVIDTLHATRNAPGENDT